MAIGTTALRLLETAALDGDSWQRPVRPFPYFNEVMTGFEYTAATGLLQTGDTEAGLEIIRAIRDRYDGAKRNPFDEAECGHHYARAMASWSAFVAWNGVRYNGVDATLTIEDGPDLTQRFWSSGSAFGTWRTSDGAVGTLEVVTGELRLARLDLDGRSFTPPAEVLTAGTSWTVSQAALRP